MGFLTKHHIILKQARGIQYDFVINRKFTIIRGDSATGKSTLMNIKIMKTSGNWTDMWQKTRRLDWNIIGLF